MKNKILIACLIVTTNSLCMKVKTSSKSKKIEYLYQQALECDKRSKQTDNVQQKEELEVKFIKSLAKAAAANHKEAQFRLACEYFETSKKADTTAKKIRLLDQSIEWCQKAAHNGTSNTHFLLGCLYDEKSELIGDNSQQKLYTELAQKWLTASAKNQHVVAQRTLGLFLLKKAEHASDQEKKILDHGGFFWLTQAAQKGDGAALANLGVCFLKKSLEAKTLQDRNLGLEMAQMQFEKAVKQGYIQAYDDLDRLYRARSDFAEDENTKQNFLDKALEYAVTYGELCSPKEKACSHLNIAEIYYNKYNKTSDPKKQNEFLDLSILWAEKALQAHEAAQATNEAAEVAICLALRYDEKIKKTVDLQNKVELLDKSIQLLIKAKSLSTIAAFRLAYVYWQKSMLVLDAQEKEMLFKKAEHEYLLLVEHDDAHSSNNLGFMYKQRSETVTDSRQKNALLCEAVLWLTRAAKLNNTSAQKTLYEIKQEKDKKRLCLTCGLHIGTGDCGECMQVYSKELRRIHWSERNKIVCNNKNPQDH